MKFPISVFILVLSSLITSNTLAQEKIVSIQSLSDTNSSKSLASDSEKASAGTRLLHVSNTQEILQEPPSRITVQLGDILPAEDLCLPNSISLEFFDILSPDAKLVAGTKKGDIAIEVQPVSYKGLLGEDGWVNLSFSEIGVMGLMRTRSKTYFIQPVHTYALEPDRSQHIIQEMSDSLSSGNWCGVDDEYIPPHLKQFISNLDILSAQKSTSSQLIVKLALETDYETYVSFGNDSLLTTAYLLSMAASVSQIYEQEVNIKLEVAYSRVWTISEDPYTEKGYSLFPEFKDYWNANMQHIERDVAVLIIKDPSRLAGGMASLDALCEKSRAYAITGGNIGTMAHELGHNFGAIHTHNCAWPAGPDGQLAPIDKCASVEGDCNIEEIVEQEGTLMSYCYPKKEIFHPLVRNYIRARAEANSCIGNGSQKVNTVNGRVVWNGHGLAGVTIKTAGDDGAIITSTSDVNGAFSMDLINSTYYLAADKDSFLITPTGYSTQGVLTVVPGVNVEGINFEAVKLLPDQYEPDNSVAEASVAQTDGSIQDHTLHSLSDNDFIQFEADSGQTYLIFMHLKQDNIKKSIVLLDTVKTTILASAFYYPHIEWKAERDDTYFININSSGIKGFYGVSVSPSPFSKIQTEIFPLKFSAADWGDFDGDGDLDMLIAGIDSNWEHKYATYRNDDLKFVQTDVGIESFSPNASVMTSLEWRDFDNDGDLDALIGSQDHANIYINEEGSFSSRISIDDDLRAVGAASWGDYDNDGDLDVLVQSLTHLYGIGDFPLVRLYRNENNNYLNMNLKLRGVDYGKTKWGDYDGDGDLDIIVAGASNIRNQGGSSGENPFLKIYRNDNGKFTDSKINLDSVTSNPDFAFGDYDSDGDLDLALTGQIESKGLVAKIYRNDSGIFNDIKAEITGVRNASMAWGDYDNDGDLDLVISGYERVSATSSSSTKLYDNKGGIFEESRFSSIIQDISGVVRWSDYDEDGDLDLLLVGEGRNRVMHANLLRNDINNRNSPPSSPEGLSAKVDNGLLNLYWNHAEDDNTPSEGLSYNLRIGTSPGGFDILAPMSDIESGERQIVEIGNAGHLTQRSFHDFQSNTYYWSVQAIDNNFAGSTWAPEQSFDLHNSTVTIPTVKLPGNPQLNIYPNPAEDLITIQFDRIDQYFYEISSLNGRLIKANSFVGKLQQIDLSSFGDGVYFITLRTSDYITTRKIVKLQ